MNERLQSRRLLFLLYFKNMMKKIPVAMTKCEHHFHLCCILEWMERSDTCPVYDQVCPSIGLPLVARILCNFTPDDFCPDPVPGMVLEELSSEGLMEWFTEKDVISTFPVTAAPVVYRPPSLEDVAEKVAKTGSGDPALDRRGSMVQRRGCNSDDDLDDLASPLASLYNKSASPSLCSNAVAQFSTGVGGAAMANVRHELLREVWSERR